MALSTTEFPNGGWIYYQPQTNWHAPMPMGHTHGQQCTEIIKHRLKNPAITTRHGLSIDPATVSAELLRFTAMRLGIPDPTPPPKQTPPPSTSLPQLVGASVAVVKNLAAGAALLLEWEESGQPPVPAEMSTNRAAVCAGCPKNDPSSLTAWFTVPVANAIRARLSRLHQMNLTTPHDDKLGVCQACQCPLKLKTHCPLNLIEKKLKPAQRAELHLSCWILSELAAEGK